MKMIFSHAQYRRGEGVGGKQGNKLLPASSQPTAEHRTLLQSSFNFLSRKQGKYKTVFPFFVYRIGKNHADASSFHILSIFPSFSVLLLSTRWKWISFANLCSQLYTLPLYFQHLDKKETCKKANSISTHPSIDYKPSLVLMSENESFSFFLWSENVRKKRNWKRMKAFIIQIHLKVYFFKFQELRDVLVNMIVLVSCQSHDF